MVCARRLQRDAAEGVLLARVTLAVLAVLCLGWLLLPVWVVQVATALVCAGYTVVGAFASRRSSYHAERGREQLEALAAENQRLREELAALTPAPEAS